MKTRIPVLCLLLPMLGCSVFESKKVSRFTMTWEIDHDQSNNGQSLVEFEFVEFPGHRIGHYSNDLVEHLEKQGNEEIIVVLEITRNLFGDVSYSEVEIDGLEKWFSSFSYGSISGDPLGSPF